MLDSILFGSNLNTARYQRIHQITSLQPLTDSPKVCLMKGINNKYLLQWEHFFVCLEIHYLKTLLTFD